MKRKIVLIIVIGLTITAMATVGRHLIFNQVANETPQEEPIPEKVVISKTLKEYLAFAEKFMGFKSLSFDFDYTVYAGVDLNEIAEQIKGQVWKSDTLYKMIDEKSELVVDSFLSVSVDHVSKKVMLTWAAMMDRRYDLFMDIKEMAEESANAENIINQSKADKGFKTFKITPKYDVGYFIIDIDSLTGFPKRIEIIRIADGVEIFDDSRVVINFRKMNSNPIQASEFSYLNYIETDPEFRVMEKFSTYELLTNL